MTAGLPARRAHGVLQLLTQVCRARHDSDVTGAVVGQKAAHHRAVALVDLTALSIVCEDGHRRWHFQERPGQHHTWSHAPFVIGDVGVYQGIQPHQFGPAVCVAHFARGYRLEIIIPVCLNQAETGKRQLEIAHSATPVTTFVKCRPISGKGIGDSTGSIRFRADRPASALLLAVATFFSPCICSKAFRFA